MFEDKLKTTDWEATNEAIEEQIARESYLQWCRENTQRSRNSNTAAGSATSSTVTSAEALTDSDASPSKYSACGGTGSSGNPPVALTSGSGGDGAGPAFSLSPKTLNQFSHKLPQEVNELGGYDSDATDMSSTSSVGHSGGSSSPSTAASQRSGKGSKSQRRATALRKKRRHETRETTLASKRLVFVATCGAAYWGFKFLPTLQRRGFRGSAEEESKARFSAISGTSWHARGWAASLHLEAVVSFATEDRG